jgi:hypothetical protein
MTFITLPKSENQLSFIHRERCKEVKGPFRLYILAHKDNIFHARNRCRTRYSPITPIYESALAEVYWSPLRKALQAVAAPVVNGVVRFPTTPGIGFALSADLIQHFLLTPNMQH